MSGSWSPAQVLQVWRKCCKCVMELPARVSITAWPASSHLVGGHSSVCLKSFQLQVCRSSVASSLRRAGMQGASTRLSSAICKAWLGLEACTSACSMASLRALDMDASTLDVATMSMRSYLHPEASMPFRSRNPYTLQGAGFRLLVSGLRVEG